MTKYEEIVAAFEEALDAEQAAIVERRKLEAERLAKEAAEVVKKRN